ncbi:MAG: hypothetical protein GX346_04415 [Clostridiales bacterium]|nr:hypothetical protein [Clostridiales bacterium]
MKKSLFLQTFWIIISASAIFCVVAMFFLAINKQDEKKAEMKTQLEIIRTMYDERDYSVQEFAEQIKKVTGEMRISIIDNAGYVLYDTMTNPEDLDMLENHRHRPEIEIADKVGFGSDIRVSETVHQRQIYSAVKTENGSFIRMSYDLDGPWQFFPQFFPAMIMTMVVAVMVSLFFSKKITANTIGSLEKMQESFRAISNGDYEQEIPRHSYDELNNIIQVFNELRVTVKANIQRLDMEKKRVNFMLESMDEGLVLVNSSLEIMNANSASKNFFNCERSVEGKNIYHLTRNLRIINAMELAVKAKKAEIFNMELDGKVIAIHIMPVSSSLLETEKDNKKNYRGGLMVMTDISAVKNSEKMRQEFFSNASHELKTPLTSIIGFSELIENGLIPKSEEKEYISKIYKEAQRMSVLVNDILEISRLENSPKTEEKEYCNLTQIARDISQSLQTLASAKNIYVDVSEEDVYIYANEKQMIDLADNLMSNAVKYNIPNGKVNVVVEKTRKNIIFTVSDTGVGIPTEQQNRVFERFYRVDKGRSRKEGSTGLGLAIVKHIVAVNEGEISLESRVGKGTKISVRLPVDNVMKNSN